MGFKLDFPPSSYVKVLDFSRKISVNVPALSRRQTLGKKPETKERRFRKSLCVITGRGDWIRASPPLLPKPLCYQTVLNTFDTSLSATGEHD